MTTTVPATKPGIDTSDPVWTVETSSVLATRSGRVQFHCASESFDLRTTALVEYLLHGFSQARDAQVLHEIEDADIHVRQSEISRFLLDVLGVVSEPKFPNHGLRVTTDQIGRDRWYGPPPPRTSDILDRFIYAAGLGELADQLLPAIESFPTPVYGSPPHSWEPFNKLLGGSFSITAVGVLAETGRPVLAVVLPSSVFVCWLAAPPARIFRRRLANKVAASMGTDILPEDLK